MLPPEAGIHSWHLLHDAALSQGVAHSAGYPGELSAKVTRKSSPGDGRGPHPDEQNHLRWRIRKFPRGRY